MKVSLFGFGLIPFGGRVFPKNKFITRIDNPSRRTHGWYVRLKSGERKVSKFFSDQKHGGYEPAFLKAKKFRDEFLEIKGDRLSQRRIFGLGSRNNTGFNGVVRSSFVKTPGGSELVNYVVTWSPEPNISRKKYFSAQKVGEPEAFRRAAEFRQAMEFKIFGRVIQKKIPSFEEVRSRLETVGSS